MPRLMCDSTDINDIPQWADLIGTYCTGSYAVPFETVRAKFPRQALVRINTNADPAHGNCLDVESGDAGPDQAPAWYDARLKAGIKYLAIYCNRSNLAAVAKAMGSRDCHYWLSTLDGSLPVIYDTIKLDAVQAFGQKMLAGRHMDLSVVWSADWHPQPWIHKAYEHVSAAVNHATAAEVLIGGHF